MRQALAAIVFAAIAAPTWAQMSPVGLWRSMDDKTGEAKSEIRIEEHGGALEGRIEKLLRKDADPAAKCVECKDALKDQPMVGLPIITGAKKAEGKDVWEGGKILDPENGKQYTLRLTPADGGQKLEVRGSIGPFGRTQTWQRVN
ncbi:DUF2147 domain-containing protein [Pulveribacter suum]|uniref:DUF2147 domain-containing protein n=1 Tax=Pulveribacter suum TaxID=2116657 RepID=A0A2P1NP51_9BURK|nr:DUF2147 domain-containing protein [Pulveribacter suum]AVP58835.1 DUF2147 domain-containing protein [Pulveribacter suum]